MQCAFTSCKLANKLMSDLVIGRSVLHQILRYVLRETGVQLTEICSKHLFDSNESINFAMAAPFEFTPIDIQSLSATSSYMRFAGLQSMIVSSWNSVSFLNCHTSR